MESRGPKAFLKSSESQDSTLAIAGIAVSRVQSARIKRLNVCQSTGNNLQSSFDPQALTEREKWLCRRLTANRQAKSVNGASLEGGLFFIEDS